MNISKYFKVGLFFIILGAAGGSYIVLSADGLSGFNTRSYMTTLEDATGLSSRSKIYLAGVAVGKIQEIQLEGNVAHVRLALLKDVEPRLDAMVSRKASSILGTSILSLEPGTASAPPLPPGGFINAAPAGMDMGAVMGTVSQLGSQISGILSEFQANQMALLSVSLETFNSIAGKIDARTDDELDKIARILESAALITERTNLLLESREGDIDLSILEMRAAMENIRLISEEIARGRGNVGQAIYDDRLYEGVLSTVAETEKTVVKLQGVIDGANEFMNRANGLGLLVDSHVNYGFVRDTVRAGASIRLEPASGDRWYRLGVNGAPNGVSSRTVRSTTTIPPGTTTVTDETETKYSISIDAELARRFGIITLRGGLLESSAGIGVDLQPLDRLALSGEIFRFRTGDYPNLRGTVTLFPFFNPDSNNPLNWIYIQGGVDDILVSSHRDFFAGGGVRFNDREIKGLVGLAAGVAGAR
ncbi:MAG: MlaD family protein [Treponema sp.]|jgi:phospholipid/cholesterol/gamma-HCH transport system substrate-binding protein|nr:MlaD family protein [Treponema sp.]